jgi:hypothetical protein
MVFLKEKKVDSQVDQYALQQQKAQQKSDFKNF